MKTADLTTDYKTLILYVVYKLAANCDNEPSRPTGQQNRSRRVDLKARLSRVVVKGFTGKYFENHKGFMAYRAINLMKEMIERTFNCGNIET